MVSSPWRRCGLDVDGGAGIAAAEGGGAAEEGLGGDGIFEVNDRGERLVFGAHFDGGGASGFEGLAEHPGDGLAVKHDGGREERLVVAIDAGVRPRPGRPPR